MCDRCADQMGIHIPYEGPVAQEPGMRVGTVALPEEYQEKIAAAAIRSSLQVLADTIGVSRRVVDRIRSSDEGVYVMPKVLDLIDRWVDAGAQSPPRKPNFDVSMSKRAPIEQHHVDIARVMVKRLGSVHGAAGVVGVEHSTLKSVTEDREVGDVVSVYTLEKLEKWSRYADESVPLPSSVRIPRGPLPAEWCAAVRLVWRACGSRARVARAIGVCHCTVARIANEPDVSVNADTRVKVGRWVEAGCVVDGLEVVAADRAA